MNIQACQMVEARRLSNNAVKAGLKKKGIRIERVPKADLAALAQRYLAEHRAEIIMKACIQAILAELQCRRVQRTPKNPTVARSAESKC